LTSKLLFILVFCYCQILFSQQPEQQITPPEYIKTIQLTGGDSQYAGTPIIKLGSPLRLTFDDITGEEADYYYRIKHYNFDWTPSQLYKNEYLEGFDETRILDYENSFNTLQIYSHYRLTIPNQDIDRLKVSGNYMIEVYDSDDEIVFSRKFIVYEDITRIKAYTKRSRDLAYIDTRQSVQFEINSPNTILRDPKRNLKVLVLQNNDLNTAIDNLVPQFTIANNLVYKYDVESSFDAGNEFIAFDSKEVRTSTVNIKHVELEDLYHHYLFVDAVRGNRPYTYNPDINGNFVVRNLTADDSNVEADYVWMHFSLGCYEPLGNNELHIYGNFNNYTINETTKMTFDKSSKLYTNELLIKQGFYNYKYVLVSPDNTIDTGFISGNFDETENEYTIIPYYRPPAARYDRVIGKGTANSRNITN